MNHPKLRCYSEEEDNTSPLAHWPSEPRGTVQLKVFCVNVDRARAVMEGGLVVYRSSKGVIFFVRDQYCLANGIVSINFRYMM